MDVYTEHHPDDDAGRVSVFLNGRRACENFVPEVAEDVAALLRDAHTDRVSIVERALAPFIGSPELTDPAWVRHAAEDVVAALDEARRG